MSEIDDQAPSADASKGPAKAEGVATSVIDRSGDPLLTVTGLKKHFPITKGILRRQIGAVKAPAVASPPPGAP